MNKFIIENRTSMDDIKVLPYIQSVIKLGKISKTSKGEQYCFSCSFDKVFVYSFKNKKSDRFVILAREEMK